MAKKSKFNWYRPQTLTKLRGNADPEQMAIAYARWLAERDGISLKDTPSATIHYTWDGINGRRQGWAECVVFVGRETRVEIKIPHSDYNPNYTVDFSYAEPGEPPEAVAA